MASLCTTVVHVAQHDATEEAATVQIHPLLYEFLTFAAEEFYISSTPESVLSASSNTSSSNVGTPIALGPLPISGYQVAGSDVKSEWYAEVVREIHELPAGSHLKLQCLYNCCSATAAADENHYAWLQGRLLLQGSVILWADNIVIVKEIVCNYAEQQGSVYRVGEPSSYTLDLLAPIQDATEYEAEDVDKEVVVCPGYETQVGDLRHLLQSTIAAPSGVLLTGPAGVGKSRLAASSLSATEAHWVSAHDLVLQAAWGTEDDLLAVLQVPSRKAFLVLDDLDAIATNDGESSTYDQERQLVRASLVQAMNLAVQRSIPVLGMIQSASQLPPELCKAGRLEKEVVMLPPSQTQRETILCSMLQENDRCQSWSELLAPMTAGCVAADLRRLCADAWNRTLARQETKLAWNDLIEATRHCVPSQLAALDVTKPIQFLDSCSGDDWSRIHELSWINFAGYENTKKRVYRTVVVPWRRLLSSDGVHETSSIAPPSGVLFHGASGCGKTLAASCLGSSLGLPMIKVRAADVLDKWLGGSEAAIRSLFARARAAAPCVLFFDEIDAVANNRASAGETADVMSRVLSTLLNEMDGVTSRQGANVLVVACTNRLETLDAALLRPGRLEEHILLEKPGLIDAKATLQHYLARAPLHDSLDFGTISQDLVDRSASGADIEGTCREAVFRALRRCPQRESEIYVTPTDIGQALIALKLVKE